MLFAQTSQQMNEHHWSFKLDCCQDVSNHHRKLHIGPCNVEAQVSRFSEQAANRVSQAPICAGAVIPMANGHMTNDVLDLLLAQSCAPHSGTARHQTWHPMAVQKGMKQCSCSFSSYAVHSLKGCILQLKACTVSAMPCLPALPCRLAASSGWHHRQIFLPYPPNFQLHVPRHASRRLHDDRMMSSDWGLQAHASSRIMPAACADCSSDVSWPC